MVGNVNIRKGIMQAIKRITFKIDKTFCEKADSKEAENSKFKLSICGEQSSGASLPSRH